MRHFYRNLAAPTVLLILTFCTAVMSGSLISGNEYVTFASIWEGVPYALGALTILASHALGHYVQARLNKIKASTPYFIPALGFVGTVGAYTKMQWPISDRKALIKIFAAGPLCGFVAAWLVLTIGLFLSQVVDGESVDTSIRMGESIIYRISSVAVFGDLPDTKVVILHPVAYAGWLGLFYNFCHILPIGRFDGGRLTYALFGYRVTVWVSFITIGSLLVLGFVVWSLTIWFGIAIIGAFSTIGLRAQYSRERYIQPLTKSILVILSMLGIIFIISFSPIPFPIL